MCHLVVYTVPVLQFRLVRVGGPQHAFLEAAGIVTGLAGAHDAHEVHHLWILHGTCPEARHGDFLKLVTPEEVWCGEVWMRETHSFGPYHKTFSD